ncbi:MAG: hypothetical protein WC479_10320 [Candidatus Izemoplasmatales bacterium]|jgi:hypothetical protein|nr:hypothetical protein [Candidatus Izemoplasmatales bacterium]
MDWYWYVIIVVGVVGLGYLKSYIWRKMRDRKKENQNKNDED